MPLTKTTPLSGTCNHSGTNNTNFPHHFQQLCTPWCLHSLYCSTEAVCCCHCCTAFLSLYCFLLPHSAVHALRWDFHLPTLLQIGGDQLQHAEHRSCHQCVESIVLRVAWAHPASGGAQVCCLDQSFVVCHALLLEQETNLALQCIECCCRAEEKLQVSLALGVLQPA